MKTACAKYIGGIAISMIIATVAFVLGKHVGYNNASSQLILERLAYDTQLISSVEASAATSFRSIIFANMEATLVELMTDARIHDHKTVKRCLPVIVSNAGKCPDSDTSINITDMIQSIINDQSR